MAFSCKGRGLCPSCGAKRAAELAAFLQDDVVEDVGHAQWVFTVPKMLRVYFLHHRELLGALSLAAYRTVEELMAAAAVEEKGFQPGLVSVVQTFGDRATFHPHVHALASRGGWTASGEWIPLPCVDEGAAERLFRHKVLALLRRRGLLSQERIELLLSWRRSGFSAHNRVHVPAEDSQGLEALVRYMMRTPVSLSRLRFTPGSHEVVYARKRGHDAPEQSEGESIDAMEFVARVRLLLERGPGQAQAAARVELSSPGEVPEAEAALEGADRAALRRRWAEMIRRVYEVDPLVCPRCGAEMRVVGFITQPALIKRILDHLRKREKVSRPPPQVPQPVPLPLEICPFQSRERCRLGTLCPQPSRDLGAHLAHGARASWPFGRRDPSPALNSTAQRVASTAPRRNTRKGTSYPSRRRILRCGRRAPPRPVPRTGTAGGCRRSRYIPSTKRAQISKTCIGNGGRKASIRTVLRGNQRR